MKALKTTFVNVIFTIFTILVLSNEGYSNNPSTCPPVTIESVTVTPQCQIAQIQLIASTNTIDGNLKYLWVDSTYILAGKGTKQITVEAAGTYTCTVTNSCGSTATTTSTFTANSLNVYPTITNNLTFGGNQGAICLDAVGGVPPYTFSWSNFGDSARSCLTHIPAGTYTVTVSDNAGCGLVFQGIPVTQPANADTIDIKLTFNDTTGTYGKATAVATITGGQITNCLFNYHSVDSVTIKNYNILPSDTVAVTWQVFNGDSITAIIAKYYIPNLKAGVYNFELILYCGNAIAKAEAAVNHGYLLAKEKFYINPKALGIAPVLPAINSYIYPVPSTNQITVHVGTSGKYLLTMVDISGKVQNTFTMTASENERMIDISGLDNGLYFLKLQDVNTGVSEVCKVVKN